MPLGIQPIHIVIIVVVALLIFGPKRLPEMGRSIGNAVNEFRNGTNEMTNSFRLGGNQHVDKQEGNIISAIRTSLPTPVDSASFETPPSASMAVGNFCIHCGAPNMPVVHFCGQCGTKLPEKNMPLPG